MATLPPTATNNDALDLKSFGVTTKAANLVVSFSVASLASGPGGKPILAGNQESWLFQFQPTDGDPYMFIGASYGLGSTNALSTDRPWFFWDGTESSNPGDTSNGRTVKGIYLAATVDATNGVISISAPLTDFSLSKGDTITGVTAETVEFDGSDDYWGGVLPEPGSNYSIKMIKASTYTIGKTC